MPKRLRNEPIYLAPQILGWRDINGNPVIYDEKTNEYLDSNNIDDKIKIYERQVLSWFLDRATRLIRGKNNGFIVLMITTSYIEGVQQYMNGNTSNNQSRIVFREGLKRIFALNNVRDSLLDDFYKHVRCGLFHNGMSGDKVVISNEFLEPIAFSQNQTININPRLFLNKIRDDFYVYISMLRDRNNAMERENFDYMFSVI